MQLRLVLPLVGAVALLSTLALVALGAARESQPASSALGLAREQEPPQATPQATRTATFALG